VVEIKEHVSEVKVHKLRTSHGIESYGKLD